MKKIIIFITTLVLLSSVAFAAEGYTARWSSDYMDGKYLGCPVHIPGCPGYTQFKSEPIYRSGPVTITGNPKADHAGRWADRDYTNRCYWEAGIGNTCMQQGKLDVTVPKRFRRDDYLRDRFEGKLSTDLHDSKSDTVTVTGSGPMIISGNLGTGFVWRGAYKGLREKYNME